MRDHITFVLNGVRREVRDLATDTTLLRYLRRVERLTGTKEGCAEGDCGACTVVLGELIAGPGGTCVRPRAVNACIQLVGMLEGKSVTTVERLAGGFAGASDGHSASARLHPVQRALVAAHGSQCGFCTPGFVMSLYAAYVGGERLDLAGINDLLAGNLCRCTGYGPIIAAARAMQQMPPPPWDEQRRASDLALLRAIAHDETVMLRRDGQTLMSLADIEGLAAAFAAQPDATLVAGATDVGLWITKRHIGKETRALPVLIHIGRIAALKTIAVEANVLRIGASVTWTDAHAVIAEHFPDFGELVRRFGSPLVRNSATVGGNIANGSPIGDGAPALIALGARLVLRRGKVRREIALEDFFIAHGRQDRHAGEFVEAIEIPLVPHADRLRCYKIAKRFDQDISALCAAFNVSVEAGVVTAARIGFGGMAGTPQRAAHVEAALVGQPWTEATIDDALPAFELDFTPISDARASAEYRMLTAKNLLIKYFHEADVHETSDQGDAPATRLVGPRSAFG